MQNTLVRLFRLRLDPRTDGAKILGAHILKQSAIDDSRCHRRLATVGVDEDDYLDPCPSSVEQIDPVLAIESEGKLARALGRRAIALLVEIMNGTRSNRVLARRLGTEPKSIRERRRRLLRILEVHFEQLRRNDL